MGSDDEDDDEYCPECGEVEHLAYLGTYGGCFSWGCRKCGQEFQTASDEDDDEE